MIRTPLCDLLEIRYPIIQGGMGPNDTTDLAVAVSNAGGLGLISRYRNGDMVSVTRRHIDKVKNLTKGTFGLNLALAGEGVQERLKGLLEARSEDPEVRRRLRVVVTSAGNPTPYVRPFKESGLICGHVVSTVYQALKAQIAGVDFIIAEGYESGGHVSYEPVHTFVLVPAVVDAVSVPVVAAGGICDARGFVAALALGAQGIQMGTRFYLIVPGVFGNNRHWRNPFAKALRELKDKGASKEEMDAFKQRGREAKVRGDVTNASVPIGMATGRIDELKSAAAVIQEIAEGTRSVLARVEGNLRAGN